MSDTSEWTEEHFITTELSAAEATLLFKKFTDKYTFTGDTYGILFRVREGNFWSVSYAVIDAEEYLYRTEDMKYIGGTITVARFDDSLESLFDEEGIWRFSL